jgi:hypothetical protein
MKTFILSAMLLAAIPATRTEAQICAPLNTANLVITSNTNITTLPALPFVNVCNNATAYDTSNAGFAPPVFYVHAGSTVICNRTIGAVYAKSGATVVLKAGTLINVTYETGATITNLPSSAALCAAITLPTPCPGLSTATLSDNQSIISTTLTNDGYKLVNATNNEVNIRLTDMNGTVHISKSFKGSLHLQTSTLSSGVYILQAAQGTARTVERIIIQ